MAALSDEQIENPMITPLKTDVTNYDSDANVMITISKSKVKSAIAKETARIYAEQPQAEVQNSMEKTLVDVLQLGIGAAMNCIQTASARFLELIPI